MIPPLSVGWTDVTGNTVYRGVNWNTGAAVEADLVEGVLQPNSYSGIFTVVIQNMAQVRRLQMAQQGAAPVGTAESFINIRLYLNTSDPDMLHTLLTVWPEMDAGIEVSFDQGVTWTRFTDTCGNPSDSTTWLLLAGSAISTGAPDGELDPFPPTNQATILVRVKTPSAPPSFGLFTFEIVPDCDVL